jgi:Ribophorin I
MLLDCRHFLIPFLPVLQYEFSAEVLSHTQPTKGEKKSRSILYGPFADVAPLTLAPAEFHYVNNAPFAEAKTLERTFDIVWNTIHVEERYVVVSSAERAPSWPAHRAPAHMGQLH